MKNFLTALLCLMFFVPLVSVAQEVSDKNDTPKAILLNDVEVTSNPLFIIDAESLDLILDNLNHSELMAVSDIKTIKITDENSELADLINLSIYKQESVMVDLSQVYLSKTVTAGLLDTALVIYTPNQLVMHKDQVPIIKLE